MLPIAKPRRDARFRGHERQDFPGWPKAQFIPNLPAMNDYPMLYFLLRWGRLSAMMLAGIVVVAGVLLSMSTGNWLWTLAGGVVAAVGYALALSYVELVKVIVDMLLPKP
jgi:hypothetical protein